MFSDFSTFSRTCIFFLLTLSLLSDLLSSSLLFSDSSHLCFFICQYCRKFDLLPSIMYYMCMCIYIYIYISVYQDYLDLISTCISSANFMNCLARDPSRMGLRSRQERDTLGIPKLFRTSTHQESNVQQATSI